MEMMDETWNEQEWNEAEEETATSEVQELLDIGYEQLDGFVAWLEEVLGEDIRTVHRDSFNAETLLEYLANHALKGAEAINEYDLRWFLFSHYIRKSGADSETAERLPISLRLFYDYLRREHAYLQPAWFVTVLESTGYYQTRRRLYERLEQLGDEREWQLGFRAWNHDLEAHLDSLGLGLPRDMGSGMEWGDVMGWREATLRQEAQQRWLALRETLLGRGEGDIEEIRTLLMEDYEEWLNTPQERLDDSSPREVVYEERQERAEMQETDFS